MPDHSNAKTKFIRPDPGAAVRDREVPRRWGWTLRGGGRAANAVAGTAWQATTTQLCGLFPFAVGAGSAPRGVPLGRHMLSGEPVGMDSADWLRSGLVANPGLFVMGQPGVGKSTILKRLMVGLVDFGSLAVVPADVKGEYTPLIESLGGVVWRVGRGLPARVNPLDIGPLRDALAAATGSERVRLAETVRARQISLLEALVMIVRRHQSSAELTSTERRLLGTALDLAVQAGGPRAEPVVGDLLRVLTQAPEQVLRITASRTVEEYGRDAREIINALGVLCDGVLRGLFDSASTVRADAHVPALSLDISELRREEDDVVAAAMLSSWAWSGAFIDAAQYSGGRRLVFRPLDELWRALRAAPGLVELADRLTRLNRAEGEITAMSTHSMDDLEALPSAADIAKARGMASRNGTLILGGLDQGELDAIDRVARLTSGERALLTSWAAPPSWLPGQAHPGRGKYLIKAGDRLGLPVELTLSPTEAILYDTDQAWRLPAHDGARR